MAQGEHSSKRPGKPTGKPKTGGRQAGTPNRRSTEIAHRLEALGCDPVAGTAQIAMGTVPCSACLGKRKLRYARIESKLVFDPEGKLMECLRCLGTGFEQVDIPTRGRMHAELLGYLFPKRKAVEIAAPVSEDGVKHTTLVELIESYRELSRSKPAE